MTSRRRRRAVSTGGKSSGFLDATNHLLATLGEIERALADGQLEAAKVLVGNAVPVVTQYLDLAERALEGTDGQITALTERARVLSNQVADSKTQLSELKRNIRDLKSEIESIESKKINLSVRKEQLRATVILLEASLNARRKKLEELKKWFWVPGYGQYLSIRTLVDGDIQGLKNTTHDLRNYSRQLKNSENVLRQLQSGLEAMDGQVSDMESRNSQLRQLKDRADAELARAKKRAAFLIDAKSFMASMSAMASNFEGYSLPRTQKLLSRLNSRGLPGPMSVLNRHASRFSNDLQEFAMAIDKRESFLTYAPASGNMVEIANGGGFVMKSRIIWRSNGRERQSEWTRKFPLGRTERIDARHAELSDMDVFWIECSAVMGPTFKSGEIRYIEQPQPELARFTATGTVFNAALHHEP